MSYLGWENEALPLGNGKIGAKVFGGKTCELIHFNEKTLWSGGSAAEGFNGGIAEGDKGKSLRLIQELLAAGKTAEATQKMTLLQGDMTGFGAYQSFGNLYLQLSHGENADKYIRDLDLDTASAMVTYQIEKDIYTRHYFVSYPDNVFVARIDTDTKDEEKEAPLISLSAYFVSDQKAESKAQGNTITVHGKVNANDGLDAEPGKDRNNMRFGGVFTFINEGGEISSDEQGRIIVKDAKSLVIIGSLATDYINRYPDYCDGSDPLDKALSTVKAASKYSFPQLYRRHLDDYQPLYSRVSFSLDEQEFVYPTSFMLERFSKKKEYKRNLITLLFQYGRYLLIASSREGSLPANLQGIWNAKNNPPWCCDYHFNINIQMNYWAAYCSNLAETALPYIEFVNSLRAPGRITAHKMLGIGDGDCTKPSGWLIHTMVTPLGFTGPGSAWRWGWAPTNGAWATRDMFEYYLYTLDVNMLKDKIYPAMEECALMWSQLLIEDKKSGRLVVSPGYSPEHGPVSVGNTYDQSIIYDLFSNVIRGAEVLRDKGYGELISDELIEKLRTQRELLRPINVGKWGQIKEWYEEDSFLFRGYLNKAVQKKHRHLSHLLSLYPFGQIDTDKPELFKAALTSLEDRGKKSTGWGLAMRLVTYARLNQAGACDEIIENILSTTILKNLFGTHPPFQIDGNFGYVAGVCEMLLQSHKSYIQLLPALPEGWAKGEITGLAARGGFTVSMKWDRAKLIQGTITASRDCRCSLKYDGKILLVSDEQDKELETEFENGITSFYMQKGKAYKFS